VAISLITDFVLVFPHLNLIIGSKNELEKKGLVRLETRKDLKDYNESKLTGYDIKVNQLDKI
jgi:hypothetical protein